MQLSDEQYRKVMRAGWNLTVAEYARSWESVLGRFTEGCVDRAKVAIGDRVLDVASGPGTAALLAAERVGSTGSVLGTDISDAYVVEATSRAGARGLAQARFERHPMEKLRLPDASFDAVICALGLMYAAPLTEALAEQVRVLAPGGRFAGCVWGQRAACGFRDIFSVLQAHLQLEVCPLFFALGVPGAFKGALERAGLVDAREEREQVTIDWPNRRAVCAAMFEGGPVAYPYSLFDDEAKRAVEDAFLATLQPYRAGEGYQVPAEFVTATARKP